jgi:gamma-glutamyltranspeptidase
MDWLSLRNFQSPGRSPVHSCNGMIATPHPLASATGLNVLQGGGNAVDAAVAATLVLAVVDAAQVGIGGMPSRGAGFVLDEHHVNSLMPRKRPLHTIMPGMASQDGRPVLSFAVVGGHFQPAGQVIILTGLIDHGLDPQSAIDAPRAFATEGVIKLEQGIAEEVRIALTRKGHIVVESPTPLGGAQAIHVDWGSGVLTGASDGRLDGCAMGY